MLGGPRKIFNLLRQFKLQSNSLVLLFYSVADTELTSINNKRQENWTAVDTLTSLLFVYSNPGLNSTMLL